MAREVTTKRSPIVLIRTLVGIELLFALFYILATRADEYKYTLYHKFFFANLIPYETGKIFFLAAAQFIITVYAFLRWYYESYTVRSGNVSHSNGVAIKKHQEFPIKGDVQLQIKSSLLGNLLHYGTITLENSAKKIFRLHTISRPIEFSQLIERAANPSSGFQIEPNLNDLLATGEHERLEFKSSLRFDHKMERVNKELEKAAMKTIAAFLNTRGGYLLIGVNDKREPMGLEHDYKTIQRQDKDGFENHFTQVFNMMIGPEFWQFVKLHFQPYGGKEVCIIQVLGSTRPVYFSADNTEHFFVRTGNITTALKLSEVDSYRRSRWPKKNLRTA